MSDRQYILLLQFMAQCTNAIVGVILFVAYRAGYLAGPRGWGYEVTAPDDWRERSPEPAQTEKGD